LVLIALAAPSGVSAAVTIGSDLSAAGSNTLCESDCTLSQTTLPGRQLVSPIDGVVVRWRLANPDGTFRLRVIQPSPALTPKFVASSDPVTISGAGVQTVPVRIPIRTGEGLAFDFLGGHFSTAPTASANTVLWSPVPAEGSTAPPPSASNPSEELLMNADIEPDADGDGFGDETQDGCPTDASRQGSCSADLAVSGFPNSDRADAGRNVTFTLRVRNLGSSAATAARLAVGLPPSAKVVAVRTNPGSCSKAPTLACAFGDLSFGSDAALQLTIRTTRDGRLTLRPAVSSATADPSSGDNSAPVAVVVKAGKPRIAPTGTVSGRVARVRLSCPRGGPGCYGTLSIGRARGRYSIRAGRSKLVKVKLRARGAGSVRAIAVSEGKTVRVREPVTLG
jgi:hypothetical protein